ncbi:ATP-dependent RNA helicase DDX51 [Nephila pilipes]|uniref:ATP-dependent RNA helicase n=1 Tax=Nephila pilipes TaxID=299642 RepID=A0A8X6JQ77_NEPPI|nr:ATP-dependent RNA helicase DDX51 [Nephila pilipes]
MDGGMFSIERYLGSEDENSIDSTASLEKIHKNYNEEIIEVSNGEISNGNEIDFEEPQEKKCNTEKIKEHYVENYNEDGKNFKSKDNKQHNNTFENTDLEISNQSLNDSISCEKSLTINDFKSPNISSSKKKKRNREKTLEITDLETSNQSLNDSKSCETSLTINDFKSPKLSSSKKRKRNRIKSKQKQTSLEPENKSTDLESINLKKKIENDEENFRIIGEVKVKNIGKKIILPKWISSPTMIANDLQEHKTPVSEISCLDDISKKNLQNYGIDFLFPVQSTVIPWLLPKNQHCLFTRPSDLCVSAPTGSGKTLAFVLPIVQSLRNRVVSAVRALVVLPVNELAIQVCKVFEMYVQNTDLKVILLTGKKSFAAEQKALVKLGVRGYLSLVDIIITTPGRILDHISKTEGFSLEQLRFLVIDEADRMMDDIQKGWLKKIEYAVYRNCNSQKCLCFAVAGARVPFPPRSACHIGYINEPLQKLLYSATLSHDPEKLHTLSLYRPKLFTTSLESENWIGKCSIPENLLLNYIICNAETKPLVLCHFIKKKLFKKVLCFVNSVERAQRLHFIIEEMGILKVREISSINTFVQRKIIMERFSKGKINLLVCSDLVARGMDIEGVDCVVSYDVPHYIKNYVHRIGRTARAGKGGTAVTLLTENESGQFRKLIKNAGMPVPEQVDVDNKDLEIYVDSFKEALSIADSKIRELKKSKSHSKEKARKKQKLSEG